MGSKLRDFFGYMRVKSPPSKKAWGTALALLPEITAICNRICQKTTAVTEDAIQVSLANVAAIADTDPKFLQHYKLVVKHTANTAKTDFLNMSTRRKNNPIPIHVSVDEIGHLADEPKEWFTADTNDDALKDLKELMSRANLTRKERRFLLDSAKLSTKKLQLKYRRKGVHNKKSRILTKIREIAA